MNFWLSIYSFLMAFVPTLVGPIFFPALKLNFFAPYLVILLYKKPFIKTLWYTLAIGFVIDLLASSTPFGFWTFNYLLSIFLLSYLKPFFFEDKFLTHPMLSTLFSISSTLFYLFTTHLFFHKIQFELKWVLTDLFIYPLLDGLFCLILFKIPLHYLSFFLPEKRRVVQSFKMNRD
jgi:hypothetical protein